LGDGCPYSNEKWSARLGRMVEYGESGMKNQNVRCKIEKYLGIEERRDDDEIFPFIIYDLFFVAEPFFFPEDF
jgi:hypothetical protein